ncbi:MAG: glutamate-5-semialdehyde dehydrogenase [Alphaproteobacteria bacterium]|nr:glutamate-5-semialdehyde dehydrogenase [Alphaproteobacteria bacterium]
MASANVNAAQAAGAGDNPARELTPDEIATIMNEIGRRAREAATHLANSDGKAMEAALYCAAASMRANADLILKANEQDMAGARAAGLPASMLDRLKLDDARIAAMVRSLDEIAGMPNPVGQVLAGWDRPNGLHIERVSVPLGVIGIIYESRPNVTADAAGLCLRAGNAVILRGGSESYYSSRAIHECILEGLNAAKLPEGAVQRVPTIDRAAVGYMLGNMTQYIDVIVPRGGRSLTERVTRDARVPVMGHLDGLVHVYVDGKADLEMARKIVMNAKMRRTGICGAAETLLVDRRCAATHLPVLAADLIGAGCEVRGGPDVRAFDERVTAVNEADWTTEYLDAIISVRIVDGVDDAIEHIQRYGSQHTESIVTNDTATAERFLSKIDSAIVMHNASTQFADGGEFGMGAEIGISTSKLHARGPVGAAQLTSYKYVVRGAGQTRP